MRSAGRSSRRVSSHQGSGALARAVGRPVYFETIGENTKRDDIPDEETVRRFQQAKSEKFESAWASLRFKGFQLVNPDGVFDSSYHIKVRFATARSSGYHRAAGSLPINRLSTLLKDGDQWPAPINPYNRKWHAFIEHEGLSALYEAHLRQDYEDALAAIASAASGIGGRRYMFGFRRPILRPVPRLRVFRRAISTPSSWIEKLTCSRCFLRTITWNALSI